MRVLVSCINWAQTRCGGYSGMLVSSRNWNLVLPGSAAAAASSSRMAAVTLWWPHST